MSRALADIGNDRRRFAVRIIADRRCLMLVMAVSTAIVACGEDTRARDNAARSSSTATADSSTAVPVSERAVDTAAAGTLSAAAEVGGAGAVAAAPATPDARPRIDEFLAIRDSAGIRIVEHAAGYEAALEPWQITSEPDLVIGEVDGDAALLFSHVPAATMRADGVIVIADGASQELRFFDPRGAFSGRIGRTGRGPGEFSFIEGMVRTAGDTLIVWDEVGARFTWVGPDRAIARIQNRTGPRSHHTGAILGDGSRVIPVFPVTPRTPGDNVLWRPEGLIAFYHQRSGSADTLGPFRGLEMVGRRLTGSPAPRDTRFATRGTSRFFATGDNERFNIVLYEAPPSDAAAVRPAVSIRRAFGPDRLTAVHVRAWQERLRELYRDHPLMPQVERELAAPVVPPTLPAFQNITIDERDNLWVEESRPDPRAHRRVTIFRSDGVPIATAAFPDGLTVLEIGAGHVLGLFTDHLDVVSVRTYRLTR